MAVKLGSIADWKFFEADKLLYLPGVKLRRVRIDVATSVKARFELMREGEMPFPLGAIEGHGLLEFWSDGEIRISATSDFYYRTAEGQRLHAELPDAVTYTKMIERRARNPELEYMQYLAEVNMNKRLNSLRSEFNRKMARMGVDPETGEFLGQNGDRATTGASKEAPSKQSENEVAGEGGGDDASAAAKRGQAGDGPDKRVKQPARQGVSEAS